MSTPEIDSQLLETVPQLRVVDAKGPQHPERFVGGYEEAASYINGRFPELSVTTNSLKMMVSRGILGCWKYGIRVYFEEAQLQNFIARKVRRLEPRA